MEPEVIASIIAASVTVGSAGFSALMSSRQKSAVLALEAALTSDREAARLHVEKVLIESQYQANARLLVLTRTLDGVDALTGAVMEGHTTLVALAHEAYRTGSSPATRRGWASSRTRCRRCQGSVGSFRPDSLTSPRSCFE